MKLEVIEPHCASTVLGGVTRQKRLERVALDLARILGLPMSSDRLLVRPPHRFTSPSSTSPRNRRQLYTPAPPPCMPPRLLRRPNDRGALAPQYHGLVQTTVMRLARSGLVRFALALSRIQIPF